MRKTRKVLEVGVALGNFQLGNKLQEYAIGLSRNSERCTFLRQAIQSKNWRYLGKKIKKQYMERIKKIARQYDQCK